MGGERACDRCGARPASRSWLFELGITLLTLGFVPGFGRRYCSDCAAFRNFAGLLMLAVAFVLAIILLA